jgi:hypothetical protein
LNRVGAKNFHGEIHTFLHPMNTKENKEKYHAGIDFQS